MANPRALLSTVTLRALSHAMAADHARHRHLTAARAVPTRATVASDRTTTERALRALTAATWVDEACFPASTPVDRLCGRLRAHLARLDRYDAAVARPRGAESRWPATMAAVAAALDRGESPMTVARVAVRGLVDAGLLNARTQGGQHAMARRLLDAQKKRRANTRKNP